MSEYVVRHGRRIEIETLEPKTPVPVPVPVKRKRTRQGQFVLVPMVWVERLAATRSIGSGPYRLALHLLFQHWKSGGRPVKLSNVALTELGVGCRKMKGRALSELEKLGLVEVERRPKKSPIVTVLAL
jgi:hypothetical protein